MARRRWTTRSTGRCGARDTRAWRSWRSAASGRSSTSCCTATNRELPFELPGYESLLCWSRGAQADPGVTWLREQVADIVGTVS